MPCRSGRNPCCSVESCLIICVSADRPVFPLYFTSLFCGLYCLCVLQPVQVLGPRLDFCNDKDRSSFLLSLVQAYRLLLVMSAAVPPLPGRWPLYSQIERENSMCVLTIPTMLQYAADYAQHSSVQAKICFAACYSSDSDMTSASCIKLAVRATVLRFH